MRGYSTWATRRLRWSSAERRNNCPLPICPWQELGRATPRASEYMSALVEHLEVIMQEGGGPRGDDFLCGVVAEAQRQEEGDKDCAIGDYVMLHQPQFTCRELPRS